MEFHILWIKFIFYGCFRLSMRPGLHGIESALLSYRLGHTQILLNYKLCKLIVDVELIKMHKIVKTYLPWNRQSFSELNDSSNAHISLYIAPWKDLGDKAFQQLFQIPPRTLKKSFLLLDFCNDMDSCKEHSKLRLEYLTERTRRET